MSKDKKTKKDISLTGTVTGINLNTVTSDFKIDTSTSGSLYIINQWESHIIGVIEKKESIEIYFKEISNFMFTTFPAKRDERVYKVVYSVVDGKWNKSEKIYGEIIEKTDEHYMFDDDYVNFNNGFNINY